MAKSTRKKTAKSRASKTSKKVTKKTQTKKSATRSKATSKTKSAGATRSGSKPKANRKAVAESKGSSKTRGNTAIKSKPATKLITKSKQAGRPAAAAKNAPANKPAPATRNAPANKPAAAAKNTPANRPAPATKNAPKPENPSSPPAAGANNPAPVSAPPAFEKAEPPAPRTRLNSTDLDEFRGLLLQKRAELVGNVNQLTNEALLGSQPGGAGNLSNVPLHMADVSSDNWEQSFTLSLMETEQHLLKEIDAALERIDSKTYGMCEATGKQIPKRRLHATPWARYCIEYAREREMGRTR